MLHTNLRQRVAAEAARLVFEGYEADYVRAKLRAARQLSSGPVLPRDLPTNAEVRAQLAELATRDQSQQRRHALRQARRAALALLRQFQSLRPVVVDGLVTGQWLAGQPIQLHAYATDLQAVAALAARAGLECRATEHLELRSGFQPVLGSLTAQTHDWTFEVTVYHPRASGQPLIDSRTGGPPATANERTLSELLSLDVAAAADEPAGRAVGGYGPLDRFEVYRLLLAPLERVKLPPRTHPEGDALYHSLQVFERARHELPYDEELQLAALLHEVGRAIDPQAPLEATLAAVADYVTPRTGWFIEQLPLALQLCEGQAGHRARKRLEEHADYEELLLLARCDRAGRQVGVNVPDLEEALDLLRELAAECGD